MINKYLVYYLIAMNIIAFFAMWQDKKKAKKHQWRISEKALFTLAIIGGAVGLYLGMKHFRHKTQKWYFIWGIPFIFISHCLLLAWLYFKY